MIEVRITKHLKQEATKRAKENKGNMNKHSIKKDLKHLVNGELGELIFEEAFPKAKRVNNYDYDFLLNGIRVDVKTKTRKTPPKPEYEVSLASYKLQDTDIYVFCSIVNDMGIIHGYKKKDEYIQEAVFMKKGQMDEGNNYKVKADCYNMKIKDLSKLSDLKK